MPFDLSAALPSLLPAAIAWAEQWAADIAASGVPLTAEEAALARLVGVGRPDLIRIKEVDQVPEPADPALRQAALHAGLLGNETLGLTLGHGIFIRKGCRSTELVSHECRHVHQYEQMGSIAAFLPAYLRQLARHGYRDAPFEVDARAHEIRG